MIRLEFGCGRVVKKGTYSDEFLGDDKVSL